VAQVTSPGDVVKARLTAMIDRAMAERVPLNGTIAMTHRCHLRCVHCYLGAERQALPSEVELDTAFWLSLVDQVADAGCLELVITGGEPLLRPDFGEVYARARRRGILVSVFTNATLVDERILALFEELPPQLVDVSLYGASAEVYERVTGIPGSYRRALAGVDGLLAGNKHEMPALRAMAAERGVSFRVDAALFPCRDGDCRPLEHRIDAAEAVAIEMEDPDHLRRATEHYERLRDRPPEGQLFACMAGLTGFHVDPRGTLLPCLMVTTHGFDLRTGTFRRGWDEVIPRFREQTIEPGYECHECEMRSLCGTCPAQAGMETGSPHRKAEYLCRLGEARLDAIKARLDK
jgi:radical SAM protein with 4Fe4S-binding SPASM domain